MPYTVRFESYGGTFERVFPKEVFMAGGSRGKALQCILQELAIRLSIPGSHDMTAGDNVEGCIAESVAGRQIRWGAVEPKEFYLIFKTYDPTSPELWTIDAVIQAVTIIRQYFEESTSIRTWLELE